MAFKTLYTANAHVTGGRSGHGKTDDGKLEVNLSTPESLGGPGGDGTNPEQLFAVGYAACFEGAIFAAAKGADVDASDTSVESTVDIGKTSSGLGLRVKLDVTIPGISAEKASEIVHAAHQGCPYSIATRGNIDVELIANGEAVSA